METQSVEVTVLRVEPLHGKHVYALVAVELVVAGVAIEIAGITARHVPGGGTAIWLPQHRMPSGEWRGSVKLPKEIREAVCDQILERLVETGISRTRHIAAE